MNALDWILIALVLVYALSGYWQGFITGAFATAGLLLGGLLGIWLAPLALGDAEPSMWVSLGALFIVILSASIGQAVLQYSGSKVREKVTWQPARAVDAIGGAVLSAFAVLIVAWALGLAVSGSQMGAVTPQVRNSMVLRNVNEALPGAAPRVLEGFNNVVGSSVFPRYLEPFARERIVNVGPPPKRIGEDPDVSRARDSVVKLHGDNGCGRGIEGTGFLISNTRVMTNAHVVAGVDDPEVIIGGDAIDGDVVYYDPDLDVAVVKIAYVDRPAMKFAEVDAVQGDGAAVLGYPEDGPYDVQPARIRSEQKLRSPDIYGDGRVVRDVYSIRGLVRQGNSGGPVVNSRGQVVGVIFAASVSDKNTGYALTADAVRTAAGRGLTAERGADTGDCVG